MIEKFDLKQKSMPAVLIKLETDPGVQVYFAELELEEGLHEVVLHVFDQTLQNFVAKRISLNIHAAEAPFAPRADNGQDAP